MSDGRSDIIHLAGDWLRLADDSERQPGLKIRLRLRLRILLGAMLAVTLLKGLARARERIALEVDQVLNFQRQFDIVTAIKPLTSSALVGFELRKLRFPKTQHIGFDFADASDIANFEVETVRYYG